MRCFGRSGGDTGARADGGSGVKGLSRRVRRDGRIGIADRNLSQSYRGRIEASLIIATQVPERGSMVSSEEDYARREKTTRQYAP